MENELKVFIKRYESVMAPLRREAADTYFKASVTGDEALYKKAGECEVAISKIYARKDDFAFLKKAKEAGSVKDGLLKRELEVLYDSYLVYQGDEKKIEEIITDVLIIGGGPSGLTSAIELARLGFNIVIVEDKDKLGGKLLLQTHKFFGSQEDSYAGTRGFEIAAFLEKQILENNNITVLYETSVVGIYKDKKAGVYKNNGKYSLIDFQGIIVSGGARERSLVFSGNDLPGVYGAGAFQTLVNRDLIRSSEKVFIVGSGNVGLIAAYHALQAGIGVVGIVDIMDFSTGTGVISIILSGFTVDVAVGLIDVNSLFLVIEKSSDIFPQLKATLLTKIRTIDFFIFPYPF